MFLEFFYLLHLYVLANLFYLESTLRSVGEMNSVCIEALKEGAAYRLQERGDKGDK